MSSSMIGISYGAFSSARSAPSRYGTCHGAVSSPTNRRTAANISAWSLEGGGSPTRVFLDSLSRQDRFLPSREIQSRMVWQADRVASVKLLCLLMGLCSPPAVCQRRKAPSFDSSGSRIEAGDGQRPTAARPPPDVMSITEPTNSSTVDCERVYITVARAKSQTTTPSDGKNTPFAILLDGSYVLSSKLPRTREHQTYSLPPQRPGMHRAAIHALHYDGSRARISDPLAAVSFLSRCSREAHMFAAPGAADENREERGDVFLVARVPPVAWNPVTPALQVMHAPAVLKFRQEVGPYDAGMQLDWLGIRTNASFDDCSIVGQYFAVQPSRYFACARHRILGWSLSPGAPVRGHMPVRQSGVVGFQGRRYGLEAGMVPCHRTHVRSLARTHARAHTLIHTKVIDDEYSQLQAALNAALASDGRQFVAIELGAWYGPWAMRAAAAARQLHPGIDIRLVGVDPSADKVRRYRASCF